MTRRVLVLAGTTEARLLCAALAQRGGFDVSASFAGRTSAPAALAVPTRSGGFGGADGLARHLRDARIDALVDATHPFAERISRNAASACAALGIAHAALVRPPWQARSGDRWLPAADVAHASALLAGLGQRVFLALGHQHLDAFAHLPGIEFVVRSVQPAPARLPLPRCDWRTARGPFTLEAELAWLRDAAIEVLVSRNSGGAATYPKLEAARQLALPVVLIERPPPPPGRLLETVEEALTWLDKTAVPDIRGKTAQTG